MNQSDKPKDVSVDDTLAGVDIEAEIEREAEIHARTVRPNSRRLDAKRRLEDMAEEKWLDEQLSDWD